jgi:regulator of replication initiation timing
METGGLFGASKFKQLSYLSTELKPKTVFISENETFSSVLTRLKNADLTFPLIAKPDKAERGVGVKLIDSEQVLNVYFDTVNFEFIIQEYIDFPFEAGVLFYRFPNKQKRTISSIVIKDFLKVIGDGKKSIESLLLENDRAKLIFEKIKQRLGEKLKVIPNKGEEILIEPIGNHNRGTKFLKGNFLIDEKLIQIFNKIATQIPDFYYGRFDLKSTSLHDFQMGKNIKIVEVNGVNSEPAHIYDPSMKLFEAWKILFKHWNIIYKISEQNKLKGHQTMSLNEARFHYKQRKASIK